MILNESYYLPVIYIYSKLEKNNTICKYTKENGKTSVYFIVS